MMTLRIDTYENTAPAPVLSHTFYGSSQADVLEVVNAHATYDEFFRAAMTIGRFQGMVLTNTLTWGRA